MTAEHIPSSDYTLDDALAEQMLLRAVLHDLPSASERATTSAEVACVRLRDDLADGNRTIILPAPLARSSDPETSQQAAALVQGSRAASENWVVGVISKLGPCTDLDIAVVAEHQHVPWSPSRLRTARKEACDHGRVAAHDTVKPAGRRFAMTRWCVTG